MHPIQSPLQTKLQRKCTFNGIAKSTFKIHQRDFLKAARVQSPNDTISLLRGEQVCLSGILAHLNILVHDMINFPPGMSHVLLPVSFWFYLGWDVADHIETSSR